MQKVLIGLLFVAFANLAIIAHYQQVATEHILLAMETGYEMDVALVNEVNDLRRRMLAVEDLEKRLAFAEKQADIYMAAWRSRKAGNRVMEAYLETR